MARRVAVIIDRSHEPRIVVPHLPDSDFINDVAGPGAIVCYEVPGLDQTINAVIVVMDDISRIAWCRSQGVYACGEIIPRIKCELRSIADIVYPLDQAVEIVIGVIRLKGFIGASRIRPMDFFSLDDIGIGVVSSGDRVILVVGNP